jgi:hypothetical protein
VIAAQIAEKGLYGIAMGITVSRGAAQSVRNAAQAAAIP